VAKNKTSVKKSAGKQAIQAGGSGKMHSFSGAGTQQPGVSATTAKNAGAKFPTGGPSGKMQKFTPVKPQKPFRTATSNSGYAKK